MRFLLSIVALALAALLLILLAVAFLIAWSLGLGWLLAQLVSSLSLFEGAMLVLLPSLFFVSRLINFLLDTADASPYGSLQTDEIESLGSYFEDIENYPIPLSQFVTGDRPLGEDIVKLEFANGIYHRLQGTPGSVGLMSDSQVEQLAIRLAEFAVTVIKGKRSNQYTISLTALKKQMEKDGQRPYDSDILRLAVEEVNDLLDHDEDVISVTRNKLWRNQFDF